MSEKRNCNESERPRKRKWLTLEKKLEIIKSHEDGATFAKIARMKDMNESSIRKIIKLKDQYKEYGTISNSYSQKTMVKNRSLLMINMEHLLTLWIEECKQKRIPLRKKEIKLKARSLFNALKENCTEEERNETFVGSPGWYFRFRKRLGMYYTPPLNKSSNVANNVVEFPDRLKEIIEKGGYKNEQIFSASKFQLFWKNMPSKTFFARNENFQSRFKTSNDDLTLLLCGNASGSLKLKPLLVCQTEHQALSGFAKDTHPAIYVSDNDTSITKEMFEDWLKNYFCPTLQHYFRNSNMNFKALLLLDHIPDLDDLCCLNENIKIIFVSPNKTSLQPFDQGIVSLFKAYYLRQIFSQAIELTTGEEATLSLRKFWRHFNIKEAIESIGDSWFEVSANNIRTAWKNLLPHHANGFCDINSKMHQVVGDIVKLGYSLGFEMLDSADVKECITMHSQGVDNDLLDVVIKEEYKEEINFDCNENDGKIPEKDFSLQELEEMFTAIQTASNIISVNDPDVERSANARSMLEKVVWCYQELYTKKKRLVQGTLDCNP